MSRLGLAKKSISKRRLSALVEALPPKAAVSEKGSPATWTNGSFAQAHEATEEQYLGLVVYDHTLSQNPVPKINRRRLDQTLDSQLEALVQSLYLSSTEPEIFTQSREVVSASCFWFGAHGRSFLFLSQAAETQQRERPAMQLSAEKKQDGQGGHESCECPGRAQ
ncbi:hypothetical protein NDU88_001622 [Pleurodeles waltl]|uniref:Uncharacterized protein n=1 Tax=Pleurodeles waltl TaxID=8319 RepID=A0AAV7VAY0_PLEWA|nr:hypothetical protein NDU88_001622 [Pleurodeles waltl]